MNVESLKSFGRALLDYHNGNIEAKMLIIRDDGEITELATELFFKDPESFSEINKIALSLCRGRVLDVGAGTGRHSVVLQARQCHISPPLLLLRKYNIFAEC
jgi:hypothetical protein